MVHARLSCLGFRDIAHLETRSSATWAQGDVRLNLLLRSH